MIYVSEEALQKINQIISTENLGSDFFVRVSVVSGGCSGLSYKMDFDNEIQPNDQLFEDKGLKIVTDLKSFLYLFDTTLSFSGGLNCLKNLWLWRKFCCLIRNLVFYKSKISCDNGLEFFLIRIYAYALKQLYFWIYLLIGLNQIRNIFLPNTIFIRILSQFLINIRFFK